MNKIALLLSGGVDSSVALHMLCQTGEKPDCFYIHIGPDENDSYSCTSEEDIEMASAVAKKYDCICRNCNREMYLVEGCDNRCPACGAVYYWRNNRFYPEVTKL